jgi:anti-anti-sigma regulatory factor
VLLDLAAVEFVDSTAVRCLLGAMNDAKIDGWDLTVRDELTAAVRRALSLMGILPLLPFRSE